MALIDSRADGFRRPGAAASNTSVFDRAPSA